MATTTEERTFDQTPNTDQAGEWSRQQRGSRKWASRLGLILFLAALVGAGYYSVNSLITPDDDAAHGASTYKVSRDRLLITVTEDGNVESANNIDVKCQVAGGGTILFIVEDGKQVKEGEVIVRLDDSGITDQLNTQRIAYEKAMAAKIQAEEDFATAQIAVKEYAEGTYLKELQTVESQITIAMENLRSAENMLAHTERMMRKGFSTPLQLEADQFSVQRAKLDLDAAKTAKTVLEKFTREKTLKGLESTRDASEARKRSEQAAFELEKGRLERLQKQLDLCVIKAPQSGMAIYANDSGGRRMTQTAPTIEEGAMVREQQTIFRLPNLSKMQVKVTVHESKVDQIRIGRPARITIQDRNFTGTVNNIANQPEPGGWMSSNVKEYATIVAIEGETTDLKPGMTAEVEILIDDLKDVLAIPVPAVVEQRGRFFCWVESPQGPERRPLILGKTNDKLLEIRDGVKEGELVLLNPRAVVADARDDESAPEDASQHADPAKQFGEAKQPTAGEGKSDGANGKSSDSTKGEKGNFDGQEGRRGGGQRRSPAERFKEADKNQDGKLTRDEIDERMAPFFDTLDADKSGAIEQAEFIKAMAAMRQRMGGGGQGGPPGERGGRPGDAGQVPGAPGGAPR